MKKDKKEKPKSKKPKLAADSYTDAAASSGQKDEELSKLFTLSNKQEDPSSISKSQINEFIQLLKNPGKPQNDIPVKSREKTKEKTNKIGTNMDRYVANTIFLANVPLSCAQQTKMKTSLLRKLAEWMEIPLSEIASIRFRCIPTASNLDKNKAPLPKRIAIAKGLIDATRESIVAYLKLNEGCALPLAEAVSKIDGKLFEGKHLRADMADAQGTGGSKFDEAKTLFIGNIPRTAEDESIRSLFETKLGIKVVRVRLLRDTSTLLCSGVGYVELKDRDAVKFTLNFVKSTKESIFTLNGRNLRISRCNEHIKAPKMTGRLTTKKTGKSDSNVKNSTPKSKGTKKPRHPPTTTSDGNLNRAAKRKLLFSNKSEN